MQIEHYVLILASSSSEQPSFVLGFFIDVNSRMVLFHSYFSKVSILILLECTLKSCFAVHNKRSIMINWIRNRFSCKYENLRFSFRFYRDSCISVYAFKKISCGYMRIIYDELATSYKDIEFISEWNIERCTLVIIIPIKREICHKNWALYFRWSNFSKIFSRYKSHNSAIIDLNSGNIF
jgi:hypothetical protein